MECNKEEAHRAMSIAEKKMQVKDFVGARKIALKARNLYPDLENISQMLTVCDVHCAAEVKINGSDDWYGILQVDPTADILAIKKQYRKLALLLHPDKNKLVGAEAAFKFIGEAHGILSDMTKRSVYDAKRKISVGLVAPKPHKKHTNQNAATKKTPNAFKSHTFTPFTCSNQQQRQNHVTTSETFWTFCPFCGIRFEYYRNVMLKTLRCQNCKKPFIAHDMDAMPKPMGVNVNCHSKQPGPGNFQYKVFPGQSTCAYSQQESHADNATFSTGAQEKTDVDRAASELQSKGERNKYRDNKHTGKMEEMPEHGAKDNELKFEKVDLDVSKKRVNKEKSHSNSKRKRRTAARGISDSSSSCDSDDSSDSVSDTKSGSSVVEEVIVEESDDYDVKNIDITVNPRRSTRQKKNVSYNEDLSDDDDFVNPPTRSKNCEPSHSVPDINGQFSSCGGVKLPANEGRLQSEENKRQFFNHEEKLPNGGTHLDPCDNPVAQEEGNITEEDTKSFTFPDPEFFDFDEAKKAINFEAGQIWAVYDNIDGLPRFYVRIKNVTSKKFMVDFNWLERIPAIEAEIKWSKADLPVACGMFRLGELESVNRGAFSHLMPWNKGEIGRNTYVICPRKGEIWALYKNWSIEWSDDPNNHRSNEYEIVEILSDDSYGADIHVVSLIKVEGFVCVFTRSLTDGFSRVIPSQDMLQFSHMIPAHAMSSEDVEGIPEGTYELDPASLPSYFEKIFPSIDLDLATAKAEGLHKKKYLS